MARHGSCTCIARDRPMCSPRLHQSVPV
jgi:hypothetical protein